MTAPALPPGLTTRLRSLELPLGLPVHLKTLKAERLVEVWAAQGSGRFTLLKAYPVLALSGGPGPKLREGDGQAPEGFYRINARHLNPKSAFHLGINLGFPNAHDRQAGWTGSALMIHGGARSVGCFALGDAAIEEVYGLVAAALDAGQAEIAVHALPFRFTAEVSGLTPFWQSLAEGERRFAATGRPPLVGALGGAYVFDLDVETTECERIAAWA